MSIKFASSWQSVWLSEKYRMTFKWHSIALALHPATGNNQVGVQEGLKSNPNGFS